MPRPSTPSPLRAALAVVAAIIAGAMLMAGAATAANPTPDTPAKQAGAEPAGNIGPVTKLPLPRYVSLKASRVNLRIGPGRDYPVSWLYLKRGLPVEIIQEYDRWRRVRDADGAEGWVYHSLLSGERTAIAAPWFAGKATQIDVHTSPANDAPLVARLEPGVISSVEACDAGWCSVSVSGREGYLRQSEIWGVYPGERFE